MLEFLENLAREAGELTLREYEKIRENQIESKATEKDIVTPADKASEKLILSRLAERWPEYSIYAEETGWRRRAGSDYLWVVDPIDGTVNYAAGLHHYCVSIGLMKGGVPVAGVIFAPRLNEMYAAELGGGATLNGRAIHVSNRSELIQSVASTGFACLRLSLEKNNLATFTAFAPLLRGIRRYGSAALDLCAVAAGRIEFYWEYPLSLYDVAAGAVIVREAGGSVTDFDGGTAFPQNGIVASNAILHDRVRALILEHDYR